MKTASIMVSRLMEVAEIARQLGRAESTAMNRVVTESQPDSSGFRD
jgi:hypothetical protein